MKMDGVDYSTYPSADLIQLMLEDEDAHPGAIEELASGSEHRREDLIALMDKTTDVQMSGLIMSMLIDHYLSPESVAAIERFRDRLPENQHHTIEIYLSMIRSDPDVIGR